jgi:hypothetical protein
VVTLQAGETGEGSVLLGFDEHVGPNPSVAVFFFFEQSDHHDSRYCPILV